MPPTGRAMKPIAKVASDAIVPATGSIAGKNNLLKTSAAADPKMKKSYRSRVAPIALANEPAGCPNR
ncbi:hypothetical protein AWB66_05523 [Caballeronia telluris]|uniref:Uncharacterized protein n=1 Tax=Caballeronia telluris TaxID=326475 RepID=A0A158K8V2_9BURK|nr:hypothetical protein AWB66_05523 [Caballeronia telluris]